MQDEPETTEAPAEAPEAAEAPAEEVREITPEKVQTAAEAAAQASIDEAEARLNDALEAGTLIKVKPWGKGQGKHVIIAAEDFDEKVHHRMDGEHGHKKKGGK